LRKTHKQTKSWPQAAKLCNIIKENGKPDEGLAYLIAMKEFEPTRHKTRIRCGFPCSCDECRKARRQANRIAHQDLFDMPVDALRNALMNRKPMPPINYSKRVMTEFIRACKRARAS
jgi:hypothetical protein